MNRNFLNQTIMSGVELGCKWHFASQVGGRDDGPNDPIVDNFKKHPYTSLIRESIQNSLDVALFDDEPVRVEYSIGRIQSLNYPNLFDLNKHVRGCLDYYPNNQDAKTVYEPMLDYLSSLHRCKDLFYIKVSDYNTKGMDYVKGQTDLPFYAFVRSAGVSAKADKAAGGSYGYGKAAYFYMSYIRTVLVSTQTFDGTNYFEGVSSLCTHTLRDQEGKFVSVGYYDNNNGEPISDKKMIPSRFSRDDPGTDIYIMGVDGSGKQDIYREMKESVLRNFWMSIYKGKLIVKIDSEEINSGNLYDKICEFFPEELDEGFNELKYNPRPYLEAVMYAGQDSHHICIERQLETIGHVCFFAFKNKNAKDNILYMRSPLMLVKAKQNKSSNGFYGVFVCDDPQGNEYLRKTENPAHSNWFASNWRINGKVVSKGKTALKELDRFIIDSIKELFSNEGKKELNIRGLEEFLYIPTAVEDDDDLENESLVGAIIGKREDEGNALSTNIEDVSSPQMNVKPTIGKIMISQMENASLEKESSGELLSGHGARKKKCKGGGGITNKDIDSRYKEVKEGVDGSFLIEIPVKYRSFAQTEEGVIVHTIIIHSDYEIENGRIDLIVGGELSDDVVNIKSFSGNGVINNNTISGLHLVNGKNILKIRFADNMKHAIKLDAYEIK